VGEDQVRARCRSRCHRMVRRGGEAIAARRARCRCVFERRALGAR
jgi:hypothetical protein